MDIVNELDTAPGAEWDTLGSLLIKTTILDFERTTRLLGDQRRAGSITMIDYWLEMHAACALAAAELDQWVADLGQPPASWWDRLEAAHRSLSEHRARFEDEIRRLRAQA